MIILCLVTLFCAKSIIKVGRVDAAVHAIREDRERGKMMAESQTAAGSHRPCSKHRKQC